MDIFLPAFQSAVDLLEAEKPTVSLPTDWGWWVAIAVVIAFPIASAILGRTTRLGMIASATFKEAVRQPLFLLLIALAVIVLVVNTYLPFFSLGEDVMMLKDCGLATLLVCGLLLAAWTASTSIADEIEGKTAMTLLSKPINRRQFIAGKYFGIMQAVYVLVAVGGIVFLACIYYKVGYDARESGETVPAVYELVEFGNSGRGYPVPEATRYAETVQVIPGLLLTFLEIAVLAAISVAIATRLPMVVNLTTCFTVFVIGHLTPVIAKAEGTGRGFEIVRFVGGLIATIFPNSEAFSIQGAVARSAMVPPGYVGEAAVYAIAFSLMMLLLAFILFEDRDLA